MVANTIAKALSYSGLLWRNRRAGLIAASIISALAGVFVALTMPRGPATSTQALSVMALSLVVGLACGAVMRSRWAMLLAPVVHIVALELARLNVVGPTVDAPRLQ